MQDSQALGDLTTQRIEAFSDGVFAVVITLLVLEIKVPNVHGAEGAAHPLASALVGLCPSYFAYIFSFMMIGLCINHYEVGLAGGLHPQV